MTLAMHEQDGLLGGTKDLRENPVFNDQKLKLGIFSANCSGGVIMSDAPTGFRVTWDQQLEIAQTADRLGMEAMVPVGRWTGFRQEFSARNVDINLIALPIEETPAYVTNIKVLAHDKYQRDIDVWTYCLVVCRETEKEARAAHQAIIDAGDWPGAQIIMDVLGIESASFGTQIKQFQERFIAGWGGPNLIGTPQQVAEQFAEFSAAGLGGAIFGFLDYAKELKDFGAEVMPILRKEGLRH